MLRYGGARDLLKSTDAINSEHLVVAEWNMNKYYEISQYGVYSHPHAAKNQNHYVPTSASILSGENYLFYDDNTSRVHPDQAYFSSLSSIFKTNRPDPGIVLLQKYGNNLIVDDASKIKQNNIDQYSARFYPFSYNRPYDYFNSAKIMSSDSSVSGVVSSNGNILSANPFVVYSETLPCNKITIKVQDHITSPDQFAIQTLSGSAWSTIVEVTQPGGASAYFPNGICNLYYSSGSWSNNISRVTDLNQLTSVTPTQLKNIDGLRFIVYNMKTKQQVGSNNPGGLEIIEMSPRLEMDITQYTESFSFNSSIGDNTNIGLPVGSVVSSTGQISLSNEENQFLFSSTLQDLKMLNPDVKFSFYQVLKDPSITTRTVPLKIMYSNEWNVGEDYSVSVSVEDGMKFLRETSAPDLFLQGVGKGNKLSFIILTLLDNVGVTGLQFKQSSNDNNKLEDVVIRNFFCKKEQTVAEVLEQLAIATQCSIFYSAEGKLNVLTKERLTKKEIMTESISDGSGGTDSWMIFDEDFTTNGTTPAAEATYISNYNSNVMSYSEVKLNPTTDGDILYHSYGPRKVPGVNNMPSNILNQLTQDFPAAALAFSNFTYATKILWTTGQDNNAVMGAANLTLNLSNRELKDVFTRQYTALNEDEAVRLMYQSTNISASFGGSPIIASSAKQDLIIFVDRNEAYTIPDYEGTVLIDKEYIKYRGKLYSINGQIKIIFSDEELQEEIRFLPKGSSIAILGLVVDVTFKVVSKQNAQYTYEVIGDGRGKMGSDRATHYAVAEESDGIDPNKRFKLTLGESRNHSTPGVLSATTKFNFINKNNYKSAKNAIGSMSFNDLESYLGFLKIAGPQSPAEDVAIIEKLDQGQAGVIELLNTMNKQVDAAVPGDFDDYVYMQGERNIYGQYIDLGFVPNTISTRMRLFSSTKKRKNNQYIMSTNSSIAGIGFGLNNNNEGYYLEVESVGAGKDSVAKTAAKSNLRFYKVFLNASGKYEVKLLVTAPVGAYTVSNTEVQVLKNTNTADPVFELEIRIEKYDNGMKYSIYYGNRFVGSYIEPIGPAINVNNTRLFMFVRNDSQAIYEWVAAAARPRGAVSKTYFNSNISLDQAIQSGIIPVNKDYLFKEDGIQYYFNDFARLVRQVKIYEPRFEAPAFSSALVDVSKVNPQYMIKKYEPTAFGAKIIVVNTSSGPIILGEESSLPLYIVGIGVEELSSGVVTMKDYFDNVDENKRNVAERERNIAIYGSQTFNLDSQYIQTVSQARNLMKWIVKYCGRQRLKLSMEVYPNPLLELGDKVRIYDKSRGYTQANSNFGDRVFVVSSIAHSITGSGPSMTLEIVEVGE